MPIWLTPYKRKHGFKTYWITPVGGGDAQREQV